MGQKQNRADGCHCFFTLIACNSISLWGQLWDITSPAEWTSRLCVNVETAGAECAQVSTARWTERRWPPPSVSQFLLPWHTRANLKPIARVSLWHIALFIALIIAMTETLLTERQSSKARQRDAHWTTESTTKVKPEIHTFIFGLVTNSQFIAYLRSTFLMTLDLRLTSSSAIT